MTNAYRMFTRAWMVALIIAVTASGAFAQGIGIGIKGGWLFPEFELDPETLAFDNKTGWQVGMFLGGNRPGLIGAMVELNYGKKGAKVEPDGDFDTTFVSVPLFLRLNFGGDSASAFRFYALGGPQFDWLLTRELFDEDIEDNTKGFQINATFGGGIEVARIIAELRYIKGLRNIAKDFNLTDTSELKDEGWAILFGFRIN